MSASKTADVWPCCMRSTEQTWPGHHLETWILSRWWPNWCLRVWTGMYSSLIHCIPPCTTTPSRTSWPGAPPSSRARISRPRPQGHHPPKKDPCLAQCMLSSAFLCGGK
ncbi:hypothetical protein LEMLEM_LOCUS4541 [Lemmus lemmus]